MQPEDDGALLRQYSENQSNEAFATLVARHINLVYSVALRSVADPHHADEVTQAVFIILARKAAQLRHDNALSSWLFQTTRFAAANFVRSEIRRHRREQEAYMQSVVNESGDEVWRQIAPLLDTAVATLNEKDRRAIVLRFYEGRGLREVGAALGANEESAKKRVARALEKLQRFFSKRGVHSTATMITGVISANSVHAAPAGLAVSVTAAATAKGAAASVSTVTLVKGALKIMAWTKVKKLAVTGGLMLILAGAGIVAFSIFDFWRISQFPDIQGAWEGDMLLDWGGVQAGEAARTHVVLTLVKTNAGYTATTDFIELGKGNISAARVTYDYPYLTIVRNPQLQPWKLRLNQNATQMILDNTIQSKPAPVLFMRTSSPDRVPAHLTTDDISPEPGFILQGYWEGHLSLSGQDDFQGVVKPGHDAVLINLKIAEKGRGDFTAEVDMPDYGVQNLPATGRYQGLQVRFACDCRDGLFQGAINADDTELIGSWTIVGQSIPVDFKRTDYRAKQALDSEKDFSFASSNDLQGHWKSSRIARRGQTKVVVRQALDIAKMPDGSYSATLTYPNVFENNAPIRASEFEYDPPNLRLSWRWFYSSYEGTLKNGRLTGVWVQRNRWATNSFPLTYERTEAQ